MSRGATEDTVGTSGIHLKNYFAMKVFLVIFFLATIFLEVQKY